MKWRADMDEFIYQTFLHGGKTAHSTAKVTTKDMSHTDYRENFL
jgi:hypothetical protein